MTPEQRFHETAGLPVCIAGQFRRQAAACRVELEDLVQQARLWHWLACTKFDETRSTSFSSFAGTCIDRGLRSFLRKARRQQRKAGHDVCELGDVGDVAADAIEARAATDPGTPLDAAAVLDQLPARTVGMVRMFFGIGGRRQTVQEIAAAHGTSKSSAHREIARALAALGGKREPQKGPTNGCTNSDAHPAHSSQGQR